MIESELYAHLDSEVGASVGGRIYPIVAPEKFEAPLIVYQAISSSPLNTISRAPGYFETVMQIDVYASTFGEANALSVPIFEAAMSLPIAKGAWFEDRVAMNEDTVTPALKRVSQRFKYHHS